MAATGRSGSSRRKAEMPGKIRIQLKGKNSKVINSGDEDDPVADNMEDVGINNDEVDNLPGTFDSGVPDDLPEGTFIVQPEPVEDNQIKKKREAAVRIDTSVLDNVSCTACGRQVNPYKGGALQKHPTLKVAICKRCEKFLSTNEIAKDKDGTDEQCRWCGEGGRLVVCDDCASAFCKACVMRNFNRSEFNNINSQQNWKCYLCNKAPLHNLRENYRKIRDTLKALQEKDKAKAVTQAATPTTNTPPLERSAGSKQMFKSLLPPSPSVKAGNASGVISAPKNSVSLEGGRGSSLSSQKSHTEMSHRLLSNGNMKGTVFGIEDINVTVDNVFGVVDKLAIATDTFREILHAVQSQSQFSVSTNMNFHALRLHCAKTLNMGIDTYIKSLKTILSGSQHMHDMAHMMFTPDMLQSLGGMGSASSLSATEAFALSRLSANPFIMPMGSNISHHSNRNIIDTILAQQGCSASTSATGYMPEVKQEPKDFCKDSSLEKQIGGLLKEKDSFVSNVELSKVSGKDHQYMNNNSECAVDSIETAKTSKEGSSILKENCKGSSNIKTEQSIKSNKVGSIIEKKSSVRENSYLGQEKRNEKTSDKELHTDQDSTCNEVPDVVIKKEAVSSPTQCTGSADDNLDTKFDLIKELADEMLRDGEDKEVRNDDRAETDSPSTSQFKSGNRKGKKRDSPSDPAAGKETDRQSLKKGVDSLATLQESKIIGDQNGETSKPGIKLTKNSAVGELSSSSAMSSEDDDDVDLATRRKMKKKNEIQKPAEKITKQKQDTKKTEEKAKTNGKLESALENSKVNGNSIKKVAVSADVKNTEASRQLSERKRKASNVEKDGEESEKKIKTDPKIEEKKKSKPGPKSSKKGTDYDHHASGENEVEAHYDDDMDDEDEPTVTFFLEDQQDAEDDSVAVENGALDNKEDLSSDKED
ncbi:unnamed protein product, partial [Candidula unifasciata]